MIESVARRSNPSIIQNLSANDEAMSGDGPDPIVSHYCVQLGRRAAGKRKPRLKPWPPVVHLLAAPGGKVFRRGRLQSFDPAHGKSVLLFSHHPCRWMSSSLIVQIALDNRWLESQRHVDSSSPRAKRLRRIGSAL